MPCRCCSATKPPKGFKSDEDVIINDHLKLLVKTIERRYWEPLYDTKEWKRGWLEAFEHHLFGCPEKKE